jgi:hypothetical protein
MINIDSRLLLDVDENELFLLCLITNRIGANKEAWPGNETLKKETGWHIEKILKNKKSLEQKGLLKVKRVIGRSNRYSISSNLIGNFVNGKSDLVINTDRTIAEKPVTTMLEKAESTTSENPEALLRKNHQVSIDQEELITEDLTIEELNREKKWRFFDQELVYKSFIDCLFPSMKDHADNFHYRFYDFSKEMETEITEIDDPTVRNLLEKIWRAAGKLFSAFQQINRPRPEFKDFKIIRETRKPNARDEADYQIKAYVDFCRISGRYLCTDPDKLPEKLIQTDWVVALHDLVKDDINKEKYDPAMDEEELFSQWLIDLYYWQPPGVCVCKRYNNRIMMDGVEYLASTRQVQSNNSGKLQ